MKTLKASTAFIGSLERARNKKSDAQNLKELTVFEKREVSHVDESESNRRRSTVARRASMITGKNRKSCLLLTFYFFFFFLRWKKSKYQI